MSKRGSYYSDKNFPSSILIYLNTVFLFCNCLKNSIKSLITKIPPFTRRRHIICTDVKGLRKTIPWKQTISSAPSSSTQKKVLKHQVLFLILSQYIHNLIPPETESLMIISSGIFHCTRRVLSSCLHPDLCAHQPHGHARRQWKPNRFVKFCLDKSRCLCLDNSDKLTLALFCQARFFCIGAASMHVFLMKSSANLARWYFSLFFNFFFFLQVSPILLRRWLWTVRGNATRPIL